MKSNLDFKTNHSTCMAITELVDRVVSAVGEVLLVYY